MWSSGVPIECLYTKSLQNAVKPVFGALCCSVEKQSYILPPHSPAARTGCSTGRRRRGPSASGSRCTWSSHSAPVLRQDPRTTEQTSSHGTTLAVPGRYSVLTRDPTIVSSTTVTWSPSQSYF